MFTQKEIYTLTKNGFIINYNNTIAHHPSTNYYITLNIKTSSFSTYRGFILYAPNNWKYGTNTVRGAINLWTQDLDYYIKNPNAD